MFQEQAKESEDTPVPPVRSTTRTASYTTINYIHRTQLRPISGPLFSLSDPRRALVSSLCGLLKYELTTMLLNASAA